MLGFVALVLGCMGFDGYFRALGQARSPLDIFYLAVQLFVLESGSIPGPMPWELEVARLLAPAVAAYAAARALAVIFHDQIQAVRLRFIRGHVVVCGLGRKGFQLVRDFREQGERVVVIELNEGNDEIGSCLDLGALVLTGNAPHGSLLRKARVHTATRLVAVCGDDGTNVEIAVQAYRLVQDKRVLVGDIWGCLLDFVDREPCRRSVQCHSGAHRTEVHQFRAAWRRFLAQTGRWCYQIADLGVCTFFAQGRAARGVLTEHLRSTLSPSVGSVECYVHIVDLGLCRLFGQHRAFTEREDPFEARLFNIYESNARLLLEKHPLGRGLVGAEDPRTVHLVLVGFGQMGESVALQAARVGHYANGKKLRLTIIDREAEKRRGIFYGRYPQFGQICDATFMSADGEDSDVLNSIGQWASDPEMVTTTVICLDDDSRGLSCALALLQKRKKGGIAPLLVRMSGNAGLGALLRDEVCSPELVGNIDTFSLACTLGMLLNESIDIRARAIHRQYVEQRRREGHNAESDPAMADWYCLDESYKNSNRQQADHIPVKLRAIGCYSLRTKEHLAAVIEFTDEEVELLARMEHSRFVAERLLGGWTYGPERNLAEKRSPYLIPWDDPRLPESVKDYDRQFVRDIPRLLAMAGERVYRKPATHL
ncbi:MAG: hypothetical protein GXP25_02805 [Planctomycetes bacterium]|nr:hypothetical protein [Planctomycetota bacterium]